MAGLAVRSRWLMLVCRAMAAVLVPALVVGASGVPKLHSKTAVLALLTGGLPWVKGGSGRKGIVNKY